MHSTARTKHDLNISCNCNGRATLPGDTGTITSL